MHIGKTLLSQIMAFVPWTGIARIVQRHGGNSGVRALSCAEQFRAMAFAQLTWRESLRDIEASLSANASKRYAMGFRSAVKRSTPADANDSRNWLIGSDLAVVLIRHARQVADGCAARVLRPTDRSTGVISDQRVMLNGCYSARKYPEHLRRVRFKDPESGKTQIWCAVATYMLIAIVKKELQLDASLYTCLQNLSVSVSVFEKTEVSCALQADASQFNPSGIANLKFRRLPPEFPCSIKHLRWISGLGF